MLLHHLAEGWTLVVLVEFSIDSWELDEWNANSASCVLRYRGQDDKVIETLILLLVVHLENKIFVCVRQVEILVIAVAEIVKMSLTTFVDDGCSSVFRNRPRILVSDGFDCPSHSRPHHISGSDDSCVGVSHDRPDRYDGDGDVCAACGLAQMVRPHRCQQLSVAFVA